VGQKSDTARTYITGTLYEMYHFFGPLGTVARNFAKCRSIFTAGLCSGAVSDQVNKLCPDDAVISRNRIPANYVTAEPDSQSVCYKSGV